MSPEELAKHNTEADCWIAFRGLVYNVTPYMDFHPGGAEELMRAAGTDGTQLFDEVRGVCEVLCVCVRESERARELLLIFSSPFTGSSS